MSKLRIALLQINPTVGDLAGNADAILRALRKAEKLGAAIAVAPELALTGYPPEDFLLRDAFLRQAEQTLDRLSRQVRSTVLICGHPAHGPDGLRNSASILQSGRRLARYDKISLPNYGVFDEVRYFRPGNQALALRDTASGALIAVSICEDLWTSSGDGYFRALKGLEPDVIVNLSASPYDYTKPESRFNAFRVAARRTRAFVACANTVGGQDELIFDGRSFVLDRQGRPVAESAPFAEDVLCVDILLARSECPVQNEPLCIDVRLPRCPEGSAPKAPSRNARTGLKPGSPAEVLAALEMSLRDYVEKNGFKTVGVSMSGGIDSALVAAIAVRALGKDRVIGATLPSAVTGRATLTDAQLQARSMGIRFFQIPIAGLQNQFLSLLQPVFAGNPMGSAEENLQARIRGTLMMALSNHLGFLLLATGNKSELATGYCTLYGDMAGGFAPIKDLSKTWVYRISREVNRQAGKPVIPVSVIRRAPTAELRPGQKDQDSLPPYSDLDAILRELVEENRDPAAIIRSGHLKAHVLDTARRVYFNEYKRRQAPIGPKITPRAFGRDRRMPITQKNGSGF